MSEPTKAPKVGPIEDLLETLSEIIGTPRSVAFRDQLCVICSGDASTFKNEVSKREYGLSGMCQPCQDKIFDSEEAEW